ncbi:uncharacterized protein LOC128285500 [Gossypium arboreum]|uniref:uncharacterized protein LOC128285500 n=1 Tax=Gossypium arboreum TaxID=29729 RepID=UPI0022F18F2E|nr:uncharacterized protein LOC128285500 [Gossypium arboreum]
MEERLESLDINTTYEEGAGRENLSGICPYIPRSVLDNWTAEEIPIVFRADSEYKACIMGICATIERKIKVLEFDDITFRYLPRDENQMADALATLASMIKVNKQEDVKPIWMSIYKTPAHCYNIEEDEEKDDHPWYHNILQYVRNREYPNQASENDKRTLRRLTINYVLDVEILYKRRND